jgi:hypothetical protein
VFVIVFVLCLLWVSVLCFSVRWILNFRLRKIGILFLSVSRPEVALVKIAMVTSAQLVFTTNLPRQKNRSGDFEARNLGFGTLRQYGIELRAWVS